MSVIANLDVNVRGNTVDLDKGLAKAGTTVQTFASKVSGYVASMGTGLSAIGGKLGGIAGGFLAAVPNGGAFAKMLGAIAQPLTNIKQLAGGVLKTLGGVFTLSPSRLLAGLLDFTNVLSSITKSAVALGAAFVGMGLANIKGIADVNKASQTLGMRVEDLSGFLHVSRLEVDEFSSLMVKLEKNIADAANGSKEAAAAFAQLGIDAKEMINVDPSEHLKALTQAFETIPTQAEKLRMVMELHGKSGASMLKLYSGGIQGLNKGMEEALSLGMVVTQAQAQQAAAAKGAMSRMHEAFTGLGRTAAVAIAPFVEAIAKGITEGIKWLNSFRAPMLNWFKWMEFGMKSFTDVWDMYFDKVLASMVTWFNDVGFYLTRKLPDLVATSIVLFSAEVSNRLTGAFGEGFAEWMGVPLKIDIDKIRREAMAQIDARTRAKTDIEKALDQTAKEKQERINNAWQRFQASAIHPPARAGGGPDASGNGKNAAVERYSKEAFEIIAGVQGDRMFKVQNEQLAELRKAVKALDEIRRKKPGKGIRQAAL